LYVICATDEFLIFMGKHDCDIYFVIVECCIDLQMIEDYLMNTHAPTHTLYKMKLLDVFEVERTVEMQNFVDYGNR